MFATNTVCEEIEKFCNIYLGSAEHVHMYGALVDKNHREAFCNPFFRDLFFDMRNKL